MDETLAHFVGERSIPVVLVDAYSETNQYDAVVSGNFEGAYQAVSYLYRKGHRYIGFVGGHPDAYPSLRDRRRGYAQALQDLHICQADFSVVISVVRPQLVERQSVKEICP